MHIEERPYPDINVVGRTWIQDTRGNVWMVSTVRLRAYLGPYPYETMVWPGLDDDKDDWDGMEVHSDRYETLKEAYLGHAQAVGDAAYGKFDREDV